MWKRIDTPLKRSQISDYSSQSLKGSPKDSRLVMLLFIWALVVTLLLFRQIGFPLEGVNDNTAASIDSSLQGAIK